MEDCSIAIANALEILQSWTEASKCVHFIHWSIPIYSQRASRFFLNRMPRLSSLCLATPLAQASAMTPRRTYGIASGAIAGTSCWRSLLSVLFQKRYTMKILKNNVIMSKILFTRIIPNLLNGRKLTLCVVLWAIPMNWRNTPIRVYQKWIK